jgi:hypothetical protein
LPANNEVLRRKRTTDAMRHFISNSREFMKNLTVRYLLFFFTILLLCSFKYSDTGNGLEINLSEGKLQLITLNNNAVRVRFLKSDVINQEELIYVEKVSVPKLERQKTNAYHW